MLYAKVIKYLSNGLIDDIINCLWLVIKRGDWWQNMGTHIGCHGHKPEMPLMKWHFSYYKDKFTLFYKTVFYS